MNLIILAIFVLLLSFVNLKRKKKWSLPSTIVVLLYLVSALTSFIYVDIYSENIVYQYKYIDDAIFFCLLLCLFLFPFLSYREDGVESIILPPKPILDLFSLVICGLSLFSLIFFIPYAIKALLIPDIGVARSMLVLQGDVLVPSTIFNTIAGTVASFYQIPMLLFFIYQIIGTNKILKGLLLVSSLSYVFFVFSAFGRDGVVFWGISFLGIFGFFKSYLDVETRKLLNKMLILFVVLGGVGFSVITLSRFADDAWSSIIAYIGQPFPNFLLAQEANVPMSEGAAFPLFRSILGLPEEVDTTFQSYLLEKNHTYSYVFGTFIKSIMLSLGSFGTILVALFMWLLFRMIVGKRSSKMYFAELFVYFLYFMVYSQGVFYFRQYNRVGNLVIIVSFILYAVFNIYQRVTLNKNIVLNRK